MKYFQILILLFSIVITHSAQDQKPNIIYIMADDLGYADLSCYGRKDYQTPHLDKFASQGIKFMNAYSGAPVCTPTRASFMTGRYPARCTVGLMEPLRWSHKDSLIGLSPAQTSIATLLKKAGYETNLIGKWHLGYDPKYSPNKNGFDYFFGFNAGGIDYISHTNPRGHPDLYENETPIKKQGYLTDLWADKAIDIIQQKHTKPFFLSIQFNASHWPWQAPGDTTYPMGMNWHAGGNPEKYRAMVISMDHAMGKILNALDNSQIAKNTLIIFTSDNGGEEFSDMGIYAGMKETLWEGGIRVPAILKWPGQIAANTISNQPVITMDWTATILAAAMTKADPVFPLDGINLLPHSLGSKKSINRTFFWRMAQEFQTKAVRDGKWKYLINDKGEYLFDLEKDPSEKINLKEKFSKKFSHLKLKYAAWEKTVLKPIPL